MTNKYGDKAYDTDVATIAAGATYNTDGRRIGCEGAKKLGLMPYATGHAAGSAGVVTFYFKVYMNGSWSTTWHTVTLTLAATTPVIGPTFILDVEAYDAIMCDKIINGDAGEAVDTLNVLANRVS